MGFLDIGIIDIIDIFLVAYLLYSMYKLIKGTAAMNIFAGFFFAYLIWLIVKVLKMRLLSHILGYFMSVGALALIIVFQQELRNFLLMIGSKYFSNDKFSLEKIFASIMEKNKVSIDFESIAEACVNMAKEKTGALIAIANSSDLSKYAATGETINCQINSRIIETIFFKNSPLHDGAMIVGATEIQAAACVLPVSKSSKLPKKLGLRHRSALGLSEQSDALLIVVSEESGKITLFRQGKLLTHGKWEKKEFQNLLEKSV